MMDIDKELFQYNEAGYTRISKEYTIAWLRHFVNQNPPNCNDKYIHLDKVVELSKQPDVNNLLQTFGYTIHHTGANNSHPNGPVKRAHSTLDNSIQPMLTGANLDITFFPYPILFLNIIQ